MKKFLGVGKFLVALLVLQVIFSTNVYAAKTAKTAKTPAVILADLDAKTFFSNLGYDVDCSYWDTANDGRQLFSVILLEDPLALVKDEPNVEVYAATKKPNTEVGKVSEVVIYFKTYAEKKSAVEMLAKILNALDEEFFKANGDAINQSLDEFMTAQEDKIIADKYVLSAEKLDEQILIVYVKSANQPNS